MYHIPNQALYHHNDYQQSVYMDLDHPMNQNAHVVSQNEQYEQIMGQTTITTQPEGNLRLSETQTQPPVSDKSKKKLVKKAAVDTSTFSIEERLLAAVWVHERKRNRSSMSQIKHDFRQRFRRDPPAKNTLIAWERKLFSTGSVCDAPRPGRPINRSSRLEEVVSSVRLAPALSLRARAAALRVPRTTLRTMLHHDLDLRLPLHLHLTNQHNHKAAPTPHDTASNAKSARKQPKSKLKKLVAGNLNHPAERDVNVGSALLIPAPPHT